MDPDEELKISLQDMITNHSKKDFVLYQSFTYEEIKNCIYSNSCSELGKDVANKMQKELNTLSSTDFDKALDFFQDFIPLQPGKKRRTRDLEQFEVLSFCIVFLNYWFEEYFLQLDCCSLRKIFRTKCCYYEKNHSEECLGKWQNFLQVLLKCYQIIVDKRLKENFNNVNF
ncbi:hypothetical protein SteCoe_24848 [Stentor coeruleus]|uniref:Uncharacterized protein n=1 Tax=Stentor coeruleus TaxID=5963 RepID=A0A1R2BGL7_9CILI|nr:hypothetical protein SteCoe_24848 [Stentor coeruleus]